jgi:hypothetical protein
MKKFHGGAWSLFAMLMLAVILTPVWAVAETADGVTEYGWILAQFLSVVVFPIVAAVILGLVGVVLNKVRKKFNLDISQKQEGLIDDLVRKGIGYAEEKAAAAIKAGVSRYTGNQKIDDALVFVMSQAPHLPVAAVEAKITAWLGLSVGVGATGNNAVGSYVIPPDGPPPLPETEPVAMPAA